MKRKQRQKLDNDARNELREELLRENDYRCSLSGKRTTFLDMHEWLFQRNMFPVRMQDQIMHRYNCIILSREQHSRDDGVRLNYECALWAIEKYGKDEISTWAETVESKTFKSFDQWLAYHEVKLNIPAEKSLV